MLDCSLKYGLAEVQQVVLVPVMAVAVVDFFVVVGLASLLL
jgi:hypothetical protein